MKKRRIYKRYRTGRKKGGQRYNIGKKRRIRKKARKMDEFEKFMTLDRTIGLNKDELIDAFERTSPEELREELSEQKRKKFVTRMRTEPPFIKEIKEIQTEEDLEAFRKKHQSQINRLKKVIGGKRI